MTDIPPSPPAPETDPLQQLSDEQLAVLSEDEKDIFLALTPSDQEFCAENMPPKDISRYLQRKAESRQIRQRMQAQQEALEARLKSIWTEGSPSVTGGLEGKDIGALAAAGVAALGLGALAGKVSSDGSVRWKGSAPDDFRGTLSSEFEDKSATDLEFKRLTSEHLQATIYLVRPQGGYVPGLIVDMVKLDPDTVEVKVGDLTSESILQAVKDGSRTLLRFVMSGANLWNRKQRGGFISPDDVMNTAGAVFDAGKMVKDLDLKDRAWAALLKVAEPREEAFLARQQKAEQARLELIDAWDAYTNCPQCSVPYESGDVQCRVCGRARNQPPSQPDPRKR